MFNPCHVCDAADETVANIVSESSKRAQNDYKQVRYDVFKMVHWKINKK